MLRYNLFYDVAPKDVYESYLRFYGDRNVQLRNNGDVSARYQLFEPNGHWTILHWDNGWEWTVRREAQLFVSKELQCSGFLIFVYDGLYWGYEFFNNGMPLDHFVQDMDDGE